MKSASARYVRVVALLDFTCGKLKSQIVSDVDLLPTSAEMFDAWFRIEGPIRPPGVVALGERIKIRGGPFSRRWAYLVSEIAGQAAVDVILGSAE
ncbi:cyclase family protein [Paraburkholderia haematera]|uniref:DIX domain-containing protein n=1 Tax=Paraburkholderia haematera TaxID=2793077 RepID=A0ABM8RPI9_9BURK|nr:hypothetical protein [Paraburkholderia haematera]CAE6764767.1 hypothetical protein R69888_03580 [Paraburkholderia haematera]